MGPVIKGLGVLASEGRLRDGSAQLRLLADGD